MKKLSFETMENVQGGVNSEACAKSAKFVAYVGLASGILSACGGPLALIFGPTSLAMAGISALCS